MSDTVEKPPVLKLENAPNNSIQNLEALAIREAMTAINKNEIIFFTDNKKLVVPSFK